MRYYSIFSPKAFRMVALLFILFFITLTANTAISEIVILKGGGKYIGQITDAGGDMQIITPYEKVLVGKERVEKIYKDMAEISADITNVINNTRLAVEAAGKIVGPKEHNAELDRQIDILTKYQKICSEAMGIFTGNENEPYQDLYKKISALIAIARDSRIVETAEVKPADTQPIETKTDDVSIAQELYAMGFNAIKQKQYDKAKEYLVKSLTYSKILPQTYAKLGDLYTILKDEEIGYVNYQISLNLIKKISNPPDEIIILREDILKKMDKFRILRYKIYGNEKDFSDEFFRLGEKCLADENYILAEDVFSIALKIGVDSDGAEKNLANVRSHIPPAPSKEAEITDTDKAGVFYQSGLSLFWVNEYEAAMEKFKNALSYNPQMPSAFLKLGECYEKLGDTKNAIVNYWLCLQAIRRQPALTKELLEFQSLASNATDRTDQNAKQLKKLKGNYASKMHAFAYDCSRAKYNRFAYHILEKVVSIEPNIKTVNDLFGQLKLSTTLEPEIAKYFDGSSEEAVKVSMSTSGLSLFEEIGLNILGYKEYRHPQTGIVFVLIPGGLYNMGTTTGDADEVPTHRISLNKFFISKYEISQNIWHKIMNYNHSNFDKSANNPIENITWDEAALFCNKIGLRLPTEAEWEYACKGSGTDKYSFGSDESKLIDYAWYFANSQGGTHPVGTKRFTAFGLYDMYGNVAEWCQDWYHEGYYKQSLSENPPGPVNGALRVVRGGSWYYPGADIYTARRGKLDPAKLLSGVGFRCAADFK